VEKEWPVKIFTDASLDLEYSKATVGSWGYRWIGKKHNSIKDDSGVITALEFGLNKLDINTMEAYAVLMSLKDLPDGWSGRVLLDNRGVVNWFNGIYEMSSVPKILPECVDDYMLCLGRIDFSIVASHPTKDELRRGFRTRGGINVPVSHHNSGVDLLCKQALNEWYQDKERVA
jgi:hypothetical protein